MPEKDKAHTKKRVSKACDCCRKSKTKCDGQRPCTRCLQDGKICTYMNKKKADQMYPASYVDLLETRVSILVQSLNQLLNKSKQGYEEFEEFCSDPDLLNVDNEFDINKVICKLLPNEKLDNLAESSENYTLDDITHVTNSPTNSISASSITNPKKSSTSAKNRSNSHPMTTYQNSPSPTNSSSHNHTHHSHYSLSKIRRNSDNHIHKLSNKKTPNNLSNSSLVSSFQTKFNINSPDSYLSKSSNSLDITNHSLNNNGTNNNNSTPSSLTAKKLDGSLESLLYSSAPSLSDTTTSNGLNHLHDLDLDNINFSDSNSNSTLMSPVHSSNDDLNPDLTLTNPSTIEDILLSSKNNNSGLSSTSGLNYNSSSWSSFNEPSTTQIKMEDSNNMGFSWNLPQYSSGASGVPLKFDNLFD